MQREITINLNAHEPKQRLMTCSNKDCKRYARHWVRCSRVSPNKRQAICHRCYVNLNFPSFLAT